MTARNFGPEGCENVSVCVRNRAKTGRFRPFLGRFEGFFEPLKRPFMAGPVDRGGQGETRDATDTRSGAVWGPVVHIFGLETC